MLLKNKDLNLILESFLRATRHHGGGAPGMAFVMTPEGKVTQMSGQSRGTNLSANQKIHYLEAGISTLVREGKCRAIGLPLESTSNGNGLTVPVIFLEHQDRSAFLVLFSPENGVPVRTSIVNLAPIPAEPRFFLRPRPR